MRDSKLELYRSICGYMVILDHFIQLGNGNFWSMMNAPLSFNTAVAIIFGSFGQVGVTGFILLSAWFLMDDNKEIKPGRIFRLMIQTIFWGAFVYIGLSLFRPDLVTLKDIWSIFTAPYNKSYWFITVYMLWYIFVPYIRILCQNLDNSQLFRLTVILGILVSVDQFFFMEWMSQFTYFVWISILVACFKRDDCLIKKYRFPVLGVLLMILFLGLFGTKIITGNIFLRFFGTDTILTAGIAVALFYVAKESGIKNRKWFIWLGSPSLAVYILHDNVLLCGKGSVQNGYSFLVDGILKMDVMFHSNWFVIYLPLAGQIVYLVCSFLGNLYLYMEKRVFEIVKSLSKS